MPQIKQFIACKNAKTATVKPFCEIKNITDTTADLYFYGDIVSDWWGAWQEEDQYPDAIKNFLTEANGRAVRCLPELLFTICLNATRERNIVLWMPWPVR